jgi:hypothetical protein
MGAERQRAICSGPLPPGRPDLANLKLAYPQEKPPSVGPAERSPYSALVSKVLQALTLPLSMPRLNQRTRWAELPCVKESGTT